MTPFAWTMLTILITAAAVNQSLEALGRLLAWIGRLLAQDWGGDD